MNSPGKYRAWDEDAEYMFYSDQEYDDCCFGFHKGHAVAWLSKIHSQTLDEPAYDYQEPIDAMQYTGLKDREGKEAYHNDIVKSKHYGVGEIVWQGNGWVVICSGMAYSLNYGFEIIGNVHEHPELLEGKQ